MCEEHSIAGDRPLLHCAMYLYSGRVKNIQAIWSQILCNSPNTGGGAGITSHKVWRERKINSSKSFASTISGSTEAIDRNGKYCEYTILGCGWTQAHSHSWQLTHMKQLWRLAGMFIRNSMQSHRFVVIVPVTVAPHHIRFSSKNLLSALLFPSCAELLFWKPKIPIALLFSTTSTQVPTNIRIGIHFDVFCFSTFNGFSIFCSLTLLLLLLLFFRRNSMKWVRRRTRDGKANEPFVRIKSEKYAPQAARSDDESTAESKMKWEKCIWSWRCWRKRKYWKLFHAYACHECVSDWMCAQLVAFTSIICSCGFEK